MIEPVTVNVRVQVFKAWQTGAGVLVSAKVGERYGVYLLQAVDHTRPEYCSHEFWHYAGSVPVTGPRICYGCGMITLDDERG